MPSTTEGSSEPGSRIRRSLNTFPGAGAVPAIANKDICTGCDGFDRPECIANCAYGAIDLVEGRALVDEGRCDECKICVAVCPVQAIALI